MGTGFSMCGSSSLPVEPGSPSAVLLEPEAATPVISNTPVPSDGDRPPPNLVIKVPSPQHDSVCVTPRRELALLDGMSSTPKGEDTHIYPYYCPLCMEFFKDIIRSPCCGNYTCLLCCKGYLLRQGIEARNANDILASINTVQQHCSCPHCNSPNFTPTLVLLQGDIRDYTEDHNIPDMQDRPNQVHSPVKIGDSFESLKKKMLPIDGSAKVSAPIVGITEGDNEQSECADPCVKLFTEHNKPKGAADGAADDDTDRVGSGSGRQVGDTDVSMEPNPERSAPTWNMSARRSFTEMNEVAASYVQFVFQYVHQNPTVIAPTSTS